MVYVTASSGVHRSPGRWTWKARACVYTCSAAISGAAAGLCLGILGSMIDVGARAGLVTLAAIGALFIGILELSGRTTWIPQRACETPQRWMRRGELVASALNGFSLGCGATTRIGFP